MKFGSLPTLRAEGAILAHSMQAIQSPYDMCLTYKIAKGTVLTKQHVQDLLANDHASLTVARLDVNDVAEDFAAQTLAQAIIPDEHHAGLRLSGAGAGRVNLYATGCGIVDIDQAAVARINAVNPMITIATVPPWHRVDADGMVATIKIIAYGVPQDDLNKACDGAAYALRLRAPHYVSATLIETVIGQDAPSDKGRRAMAARVQRFGMMLSDRVLVPHREEELAAAILAAPGEVVFILTGSATSDPLDVAPQALRRAGGKVTRFGMPVDPGNLLFLGCFGGKPMIGLPGCARSVALNGADWVLERVICGLDLGADDIAAMGVGGLLKEIPTRPMPRRG